MCDGSSIDWLPDLVLFEDYEGNWEKYLDALYTFFKEDFVQTSPVFNSVRLQHKKHPLYDGKESAFWHIISYGSIESERLPDLRKCERIRWPKPVIEHSHDDRIKIWRNIRRKNEKRILIWFEDMEYLVVLADRNRYILFWTAYPVQREHTKSKLKKEYEEYCKNS